MTPLAFLADVLVSGGAVTVLAIIALVLVIIYLAKRT